MQNKTQRITELLGIINNKSIRIKELKLECGQQSTKICVLNLRITELETENDKFEGALLRIDTWAKAYPLDVFPKPDLKQAAKVLKAAGMTLDAIEADAMRHVIDGVKDITKQALKGGD